MQAVADVLGVDRSAVNYYVGDRDGLLEIVVADLFEERLRQVTLPDDEDWRELLCAYGNAILDGALRLGVAATYFRLDGAGGAAGLALAERVLGTLAQAGFTAADAGRILALIAGLAFSAARTAATMPGTRVHPQTPIAAEALKDRGGDYPLLCRVVAERESEDAVQRDFEFGLRVVVAGLDRMLG